MICKQKLHDLTYIAKNEDILKMSRIEIAYLLIRTVKVSLQKAAAASTYN